MKLDLEQIVALVICIISGLIALGIFIYIDWRILIGLFFAGIWKDAMHDFWGRVGKAKRNRDGL